MNLRFLRLVILVVLVVLSSSLVVAISLSTPATMSSSSSTSTYAERLPSPRETEFLGVKVLELTYPIQNDVIKWFDIVREVKTVATVPTHGYYALLLNSSSEHTGTHVDAPVHFNANGWFINEIPLDRLYGVALVIDARKYISHPNDTITMSELRSWEKSVGFEISRGSIVLIYTGWANYWGIYSSWSQYWSIARGWPGLSADAAKYLVEKGVIGIGIDTLSIDPAPATNFPAHQIITEANIYIIENLNTNIEKLADNAAFLMIAPLKTEKGSAGPGLEVLAFYDSDADIHLNMILANLMKMSFDLADKYDLALLVKNGMPAWFTIWSGFTTVGTPEEMIKKYSAYYGSLTMTEHTGTHMDAPAHFAVNVWRINEIPLDRLWGRAVIMDMSSYIKHSNYSLTVNDIKSWEEKTGIVISRGDIVLINTGWIRYWGIYKNWNEYWSKTGKGFPGITPEAAEYLVSKGIKGVALDVLSIDPPPQTVDFPVHKIIVSKNIWIGENFNFAILPRMNVTAFIFSLPAVVIKEGSGAPARPIILYNFNLESIINTYKAIKAGLTSQ